MSASRAATNYLQQECGDAGQGHGRISARRARISPSQPTHPRGAAVLIKVMRNHLRDYKGLLTAVVVLQAVQAIAILTLPSITADIIDGGILNIGPDGTVDPDQGYIW